MRPYTLSNIKNLASAIFAHAVAVGACDSNPIRDAQILGKTLPDGETGFYSLEEIEDIISALVDHPQCQLIMALAFFFGLRRGEIQGLQWGDVDAAWVHVRRNFVRGKTTTLKGKQKSKDLPLIQPVRGLLELWRAKGGDGVWLFNQGLPVIARSTIIPVLRGVGLT